MGLTARSGLCSARFFIPPVTKEADPMKRILQSESWRKFIEKTDQECAQEMRAEGCQSCPGVLHRSDYPRKPRGWGARDQTVSRISFCCGQEGCRKRHTPPSLQFMGRRRYEAAIMVLLPALMQGATERRVRQVKEQLGVDRRTLVRWREWWLELFVQSAFWRGVKGRFQAALDEGAMPDGLVKAFGAWRREGLEKLLLFLRPISIGPLEPAGVK